ncbi:unnamed protein product [Lasius platythorax]|uniref:Uncharacterized protein n=2 Tax=Lasius TaxID=488720 RepID=A0A0J7K3K7_LASNI|nr:hypothetical protein RF55_16925 [Lasius niger]
MKNKIFLKPTELPCTNKYAVLTDKKDDEDMDDYNADEEKQEREQRSNKPKNVRRPPPLVIHGKVETRARDCNRLVG